MKKIRKIFTILLMMMMVFSIYGCGAKSPSNALSDYLDLVKKGEDKSVATFLNKQVSSVEKEKENGKSESEQIMLESLKKITYKINSESVNGNTAKVNVTLNGPDFEAVFSEFLQKAFADVFSQALSGKEMSKEESEKYYENLLCESLKNMKYTDRTQDIELIKENEEWKVKDENSILKLVINFDPDTFDAENKINNTK